MDFRVNKKQLEAQGYSILSALYSDTEINEILKLVSNPLDDRLAVLKTKDLFAIRQLTKTVPLLWDKLLNEKLETLLSHFFSKGCYLTKAIYFDKPKESNWFVAYHQDLSVSVDRKEDVQGYKNWTFKKGQYGVQPPESVLNNIVTVRIHLDNTTKENGALKIIPQSHKNGVVRLDTVDIKKETAISCEVTRGGVMLMKPLTLHASNRTTNNKQRRVIHLEFSDLDLESPLIWLEKLVINRK